MNKVLILGSALCLLIGISGCTVLKRQSEGPVENNNNQAGTECLTAKCPPKQSSQQKLCNTSVENQLLVAAQSIEDSLSTLAAAEKAESAPILSTAALVTAEGGMGGTADVDWTGPIGPLVCKIGTMTNYHVKFLGTEPAIPVLVAIRAKRGVIADILQNASFQAGKRAHVLVFPATRVIEVRYLS